jgi:hypothetical protein
MLFFFAFLSSSSHFNFLPLLSLSFLANTSFHLLGLTSMEANSMTSDTHLYGMASQEDGLWRDKDGKEAPGAIGKDPGRFSWAKGVVGAIQRVRGAGGF